MQIYEEDGIIILLNDEGFREEYTPYQSHDEIAKRESTLKLLTNAPEISREEAKKMAAIHNARAKAFDSSYQDFKPKEVV